MAMNWATKRTESGKLRTSSIKLTPPIKVTAIRNHGVENPKKKAHVHKPSKKIMPPPLKTIEAWELRSLGLSMILNLSAIWK